MATGDDYLAHAPRADLYRRLESAAEARAACERALGTTRAELFFIRGAIAGGEPGEDGHKRVRYMLLIYGDEQALDESEREECYRQVTQLAHEIHAAGQYLASAPLHATWTATSIRVREGKRLVTDGPFAETREQLGGYFLIDARDLDQAIAVAARMPMARRGTIEIRPVIEIAGLPAR